MIKVSSEISSAAKKICIVRDLLGEQITVYLEQLSVPNIQKYCLWRALNSGVSKLTDDEILCVCRGLSEVADACKARAYVNSEVQKVETVDALVGLSTVRNTEFNIHRQLKVFLMQGLKHNAANDHIYAYNDKFKCYGRLLLEQADKRNFYFLLHEIDPLVDLRNKRAIYSYLKSFNKNKKSLRDHLALDKDRLQYLFKLRKYCRDIGIYKFYIDPKFFKYDKQQSLSLSEQGFESPYFVKKVYFT